MDSDAKAVLQKRLKQANAKATWALKSEAAKGINGMVDLARSEPGIGIRPAILDRNPDLFNCASGTIDLTTGQLRSHSREDYITKLCPTPYEPDAPCPTWLTVLAAIFEADEELIRFVHRL